MQSLLAEAAAIGALLKKRRETLAVAEGAAGGLVSAALLTVPGASAYFLGGGVIYTRAARTAFLGITEADLVGFRPATERYALLLANRAREKLGADLHLADEPFFDAVHDLPRHERDDAEHEQARQQR